MSSSARSFEVSFGYFHVSGTGRPLHNVLISFILALGGHSTPPPLSPHLLIIHAYYNYLGCFTCAAPDCSLRCYSTPRALSSGSTQEAEKSQSLGLPLLDPWYSFGGSRPATRATSGSFSRCRVSTSVSPKPARVLGLRLSCASPKRSVIFRQKFYFQFTPLANHQDSISLCMLEGLLEVSQGTLNIVKML